MEEKVNQLLKFGVVLGSICLAATLVLAVTYEVTKPKIEAQAKAEEENALKIVMAGADSFTEKSVDGITYFEAIKGTELVGYCVKVIASGYNGYIRMIVGVDPKGIIKGLEVLEQSETPGLGSKITEIRPGEKEPYFLAQFKGKLAETLAIKKNIDAITGATITSKAVTDAVKNTLTEFLAKVKK
jgi:Na+-translocating ferredoxin:NAD+ oxidoreductase subunit G